MSEPQLCRGDIAMIETWGTARWFPLASASQHEEVREKFFETGENSNRWSQSLRTPLCTALLCLMPTGCLSCPPLLKLFLSASLCTPHLLLFNLLLFSVFSLPFTNPHHCGMDLAFSVCLCTDTHQGTRSLPAARCFPKAHCLASAGTPDLVHCVTGLGHGPHSQQSHGTGGCWGPQGRSSHCSNHLHHSADMESSAPDTLLEFSSLDRQG